MQHDKNTHAIGRFFSFGLSLLFVFFLLGGCGGKPRRTLVRDVRRGGTHDVRVQVQHGKFVRPHVVAVKPGFGVWRRPHIPDHTEHASHHAMIILCAFGLKIKRPECAHLERAFCDGGVDK